MTKNITDSCRQKYAAFTYNDDITNITNWNKVFKIIKEKGIEIIFLQLLNFNIFVKYI